MSAGLVSCPADSCATQLQRTTAGSLIDGVAAHLAIVHGMPGPSARELAGQAVARSQGGRQA